MGDHSPILLFPHAPKDAAATPVDRAAIQIAEFLAEQTAVEIVSKERNQASKPEVHS